MCGEKVLFPSGTREGSKSGVGAACVLLALAGTLLGNRSGTQPLGTSLCFSEICCCAPNPLVSSKPNAWPGVESLKVFESFSSALSWENEGGFCKMT